MKFVSYGEESVACCIIRNKYQILVHVRFSDIQEKAMMGMNIIPSIFLEKFNTNEMKDMLEIFEYYVDDLPYPGSFEAELLQ